MEDGDNGIRIRKREWLQQDRVHDAKDGSIGANPQRQHGERRESEPGVLAKHANGVGHGLQKVAHERYGRTPRSIDKIFMDQ